MPDSKYGKLPKNLVVDTRFKNKSMYFSDYCSRRRPIPTRRRAKTKETIIHAQDMYNPTSRLLNDHYQTRSHRELTRHCRKILNSIERTSSRTDVDLAISRGRKTPIYDGIPSTPYDNEDDQPIAELLPASLRRIESAWQEEANATKRERGDLYRKAGTKQWYHQRLREDAAKRNNPKYIPGLTKWLTEANEFEKIVVHDFMKNVSDTIKEEETALECVSPKDKFGASKTFYSDNPKMEDYIDLHIDKNEQPDIEQMISPRPLSDEEGLFLDEQNNQFPDKEISLEQLEKEIEDGKNVTFRYPTRETIVTPQQRRLLQSRASSRSTTGLSNIEGAKNGIERAMFGGYLKERAQSAMSMHSFDDKYQDLAQTQRPKSSLGIYDKKQTYKERPSSSHSSSRSAMNKRAKSAEVPRRTGTPELVPRGYSAGSNRNFGLGSKSHVHSGANCASCQKREIEMMAEQLAGMQPRSYGNLKKEQRDKPKMALSKMYKASLRDYSFAADDYVYNQSVFGKASAKGKGHFVIHPEWVSERTQPKKSYR